MNEDERWILEQLFIQRESVLDLWTNLLTVALAVIAYYGSFKNTIASKATYVLVTLFILFSGSNFRAIYKNFSLREDLKAHL